jgi:hypothetical protein
METLHGMHIHGFPNLFIIGFNQAANLISNVTSNLVDAGATIGAIVAHAEAVDAVEVEVTAEAERAWMELLAGGSGMGILGSPDCTPGYYNNEGQPLSAKQSFAMTGYPAGPVAYFAYIEQWRTSGDFAGLEFRPAPGW